MSSTGSGATTAPVLSAESSRGSGWWSGQSHFYFFLRIFISSCQCLYCVKCLPQVMIDGRCSRCKIGNVAVQAIDKDLSPGAKILFKPLTQHSFKSLEVKERFKQRQLNRTYVTQGMFRERCKSEKKKLEQIFEKEKKELSKLQKCKEEKLKKIQVWEEKSQVLEETARLEDFSKMLEVTKLSEKSPPSFELENNERSTDSVDPIFLSF